MITKSEENEIRDYLLSKKLPIDILLEVNDHFIAQIKTLEFEKCMKFEEAFKTVKENWRQDLTLSWAGGMDITDSNLLMRKIKKNIQRAILISTFKLSLISLLVAVFGNLVLSDIAFKYFLIVLLSVIFSVPLINLIVDFKKFWLPRKYQDHILTLHQGPPFVIGSVLIFVAQYLQRTINHPEYFRIFNFSALNKIEFWRVILIYFGMFSLFLVAFYILISQIKFLKQLKIVRPFLKYLKTS
jgi:hypothetical protein